MSKVSTFMKKAAVLRKNKTLRMYRNFFMTQLAFFVFTIIALTVKAEEGILILVFTLIMEFFFMFYSKLVIRVRYLEEEQERKIKKGSKLSDLKEIK